MNIAHIGDCMLQITLPDKTAESFLGLRTGIAAESKIMGAISSRLTGDWYIVREEYVMKWNVAGILQHENEMVIYGPYLDGAPLAEILEQRAQGLLPYASRLSRALLTLEKDGYEYPIIAPYHILFLVDGSVLIPAQSVAEIFIRHIPEERRYRYFQLCRHPDLNHRQNLSYALAVLSYATCSGSLPFDENLEWMMIREHMRHGVMRSILETSPDIRASVAEVIEPVLLNPKRCDISLNRWTSYFQQWLRQGVCQEFSASEMDEARRRGAAITERNRRAFDRRNFWRRRSKMIWLAGIACFIVAFFTVTIIGNLSRQRATAGLSSVEVVRLFYLSQNRLDHETMRDCVAGRVGKGDIDEVSNLYVISRVRLAVENYVGLIDPRVWRNRGEPDLGDAALYGVENLAISVIRANENAIEIEANYRKWRPVFDGEDHLEGYGNSVAFEQRDRLLMKMEGNDWSIADLTRLYQRQIVAIER